MTLKVVFFTQLFCPFAGGTPWKPTSAQLLCGPRVWRPQLMVKDIEGYPIFALGAQNLLDTYPTRNPFAGVAGAEYTLTSPFGFNGGSYYIRARFNWYAKPEFSIQKEGRPAMGRPFLALSRSSKTKGARKEPLYRFSQFVPETAEGP